MFKRKRQRTIVLSRKTMEALNRLRFLLENEEFAQGLGEPAEIDIHLDPVIDGPMRISFLTDKDFRDAEERGLSRPADTERKTAVVDPYDNADQITLYDGMGLLICKRRVLKFDKDPVYVLF